MGSVLNRPGRSSGRLRPGLQTEVRAGLKPPGAAWAMVPEAWAGLGQPGLFRPVQTIRRPAQAIRRPVQAGPGFMQAGPGNAGRSRLYAGQSRQCRPVQTICRLIQAMQAIQASLRLTRLRSRLLNYINGPVSHHKEKNR